MGVGSYAPLGASSLFRLPEMTMLVARHDGERREDVVAGAHVDGRADLDRLNRQTIGLAHQRDLLRLPAFELGDEFVWASITLRDPCGNRFRLEPLARPEPFPQQPAEEIAAIPRRRRAAFAPRLLDTGPHQRHHRYRREIEMGHALTG